MDESGGLNNVYKKGYMISQGSRSILVDLAMSLIVPGPGFCDPILSDLE